MAPRHGKEKMNNDQLNSLVRSAMKFIGGFLIAHGVKDASSIATAINLPDVIGFLVMGAGLLWSHIQHAGDPPTPPAGIGSKLSAFIAIGALSGLMCSGCASTPAGKAYQGEAATHATIDAAMTAWGDYVASRHPGTNQEATVKIAFQRCQAAELSLIDASALYAALKNQNAETNLLTAATDVQNCISDLFQILDAFGVKVPGQ